MNLDYKRLLNYSTTSIAEKWIYFFVISFVITLIFKTTVFSNFALPADLNEFMGKPWTIFSYAFVHQSFIHLIVNLIALFYLGALFLDFYSEKAFLYCFVSGILFGGLLFLSNYMIFSKTGLPLGGASAAIAAIFIAIATKIPNYKLHFRLIGSVKLWILAAVWIGINLLQLFNEDNGGAVAHLGGALAGYLFSLQKEGSKTTYRKRKQKETFKSRQRKTTQDNSRSRQKKIDAILDKISKSGYDNLTKEEKEFLFKAGKK